MLKSAVAKHIFEDIWGKSSNNALSVAVSLQGCKEERTAKTTGSVPEHVRRFAEAWGNHKHAKRVPS